MDKRGLTYKEVIIMHMFLDRLGIFHSIETLGNGLFDIVMYVSKV